MANAILHTRFKAHFGYDSLRELPDMEALEDAGLLSKDKLLAGEFPLVAGVADDQERFDHDG